MLKNAALTRNRSFFAFSLAKGAKEVTKFLEIVEQVGNSVHKAAVRAQVEPILVIRF